MNDSIIKDSLKMVSEKIIKSTETESLSNWWMWIAIAEFAIIAILLLKDKFRPKNSYKKIFKNESLKENIDFDNILNSAFNSKQLYNELKVKCHPDRFATDKEAFNIAEKIFQEITKEQNNIKRLLELKEEANQKLNINF